MGQKKALKIIIKNQIWNLNKTVEVKGFRGQRVELRRPNIEVGEPEIPHN